MIIHIFKSGLFKPLALMCISFKSFSYYKVILRRLETQVLLL